MAFDFTKPNSTPNRRTALAISPAIGTGLVGTVTAVATLFQAPAISTTLQGLQSVAFVGSVQAIPNIVLLSGVAATGHLSDDDAGGIVPSTPNVVALTGIKSQTATGQFGGIAPSSAPRTLPTSALNIPAILKTLVVPGGPCQGALFNTGAKNGIVWYNSNVALSSICQFLTASELDSLIRPYLDAYVLFLSSDGSINDVNYSAGAIDLNAIGLVPQASDDCYAATFIRLVYRYALASQNFAWFDTNRGALANIIENNIFNNRRADGLVSQFAGSRRTGAGDVALLKNNCEDWAALNEMSALLTQRNDAFNASRYAVAASSIASAIDTTLWTPSGPLSPGFKNSDLDVVLSSTFNPNVVAHAYPQSIGVTGLTTRYTAAYNFINANALGWENLGYDPSPWMVLGLTAALRADTVKANTQTSGFETLYGSAPTTVAANELGMYQRIKSVLAGLPSS